MNVKSETVDCKICNFFEKLWNGEIKEFLIFIAGFFVLAVISIGGDKIVYAQKMDTKYQSLVKDTPILKCGTEMQVNPSNYKVVLVDGKPLIKVFYSDTRVVSYDIDECSIITQVVNAELGVDNVQFVNSELKVKNDKLVAQIKHKQKQYDVIVTKNKQLKKDYNLPTQKELDIHYNNYIKSKKKDINQYLSELHLEEKKVLAKARAEDVVINGDDCYDEALMTDPEIHTLWLAGKCDEINWRLANGTLRKK